MKRTHGFTLIELAIVLVIVTILIGGLAMPLSAQIQARRIAETQKILEEAREAIIGYAMSNTTSSCTCVYTSIGFDDINSTCSQSLCPASPGLVATTDTATLTLQPRHYLPCPDLMQNDPEESVDNDGDGSLRDLNNGREDRYTTDQCATLSGNLPWVTLGTASQDAWGNRLRYTVTGTFADKSIGLPGTGGGDLQVCSASGCATVDVASNVPAVLVSHGPNGWGARSIHNKMLADPTSDDV